MVTPVKRPPRPSPPVAERLPVQSRRRRRLSLSASRPGRNTTRPLSSRSQSCPGLMRSTYCSTPDRKPPRNSPRRKADSAGNPGDQLVADSKAPATGHHVVDVPAEHKDNEQATQQREANPDPHPLLLPGGRHLLRTPLAEIRLHPGWGRPMQVEVAEQSHAVRSRRDSTDAAFTSHPEDMAGPDDQASNDSGDACPAADIKEGLSRAGGSPSPCCL